MKVLNYTCCGDHFAIYTNIGLLHCTPETNIMLHVNAISIENISKTLEKK